MRSYFLKFISCQAFGCCSCLLTFWQSCVISLVGWHKLQWGYEKPTSPVFKLSDIQAMTCKTDCYSSHSRRSTRLSFSTGRRSTSGWRFHHALWKTPEKDFQVLESVLPENMNKKSPNFWKPQKTYIKAILKSQKTYIKGLPKGKNINIKALKIMLKTGLNRFFEFFWKVAQKGAKF